MLPGFHRLTVCPNPSQHPIRSTDFVERMRVVSISLAFQQACIWSRTGFERPNRRKQSNNRYSVLRALCATTRSNRSEITQSSSAKPVSIKSHQICAIISRRPGGETGRRTGLKIPGRKACGFDSRPGHQTIPRVKAFAHRHRWNESIRTTIRP